MTREPQRPCAVNPTESLGRQFAEATPRASDPFALDRWRIVHCASFRRLQYKTQVFVISEHDHFRTRLTHTLEVADIARRLAEMLGVNALLAETIALAHDLGHAPFGHAGEQALAARMSDHGGFEHNAQSLRIVEFLEHPYPPFRGLNLSYEVREGLAKHRTTFDTPHWHDLADGTRPTVEAQIASAADRIAFCCHDLEDAIGAEIVNAAELEAVPLWRETAEPFYEQFGDRPLFALRRAILDALEQELMDDVVEEAEKRLADRRVETLTDVRQCDIDVVDASTPMAERLATLERFLGAKLYRHHRVIRMDDKAQRFIDQLFAAYLDEPGLLPPRFANRVQDQGLHGVVCDYIAGMTDRFCTDEYKRLFSPFERV